MSTLKDLVYSSTWNLSLFQGTFNNSANKRPVLFNPRNSGQNIILVSYVISIIGSAIAGQSPQPSIMSQGMFSYIPNSNGGTPATSVSAGTNFVSGAAGKLVLNTDAAFPAGGLGPNLIVFGVGQSDIQVNSSRDLKDVVDIDETPLILYPGDCFGTTIAFVPNNQIFVQYSYIQVTP